jgi:magnesium transporter
MALFEGSPNDPSSLPPRLQRPPAHLQDPSASLYQTAPPPTGILHTGHDRPYRFSFYSNTLAATIHARSLSELPADGQSFEDLFCGISPGNGFVPEKQGTTRPLSSPSYNGRPTTALGGNKGTATMHNSLDSSYFNNVSGTSGGRKTDSKGALMGGGGGGNGKYETDGDSDAKTWWLDIQSPTDEEMKMLSKVGVC